MSEETKDEQASATARKKLSPKTLIAEIERYEKKAARWERLCGVIRKRYRDDERSIDDRLDTRWTDVRFNVLWSNVQTLQPTLYARTPKTECERRYRDPDPIGRVAATVSERLGDCLVSGDDGDDSFDVVMTQARDDYLLTARGTAWARLENLYGEEQIAVDDDGEPVYDVVEKRVVVDFIPSSDFGHNVARFWKEVFLTWKKLHLTKEEITERLGAKAAALVNFDQTDDDIKEENENLPNKATIYECWHKPTRSVYWLDKNQAEEFLKVKPDFLHLRNFFPCPRPLYGTLTNDSLIPVPDYQQYKTLADQLDILVARRERLIRAAQVKGARSGNHPQLDQLLDDTGETGLVPVDDFVRFAADGGLKGLIDWLPIESIIEGIQVLTEQIREVKAELYEITGIADIIRGHSAPSETATAQQIKGQFATLRLEDRQRNVQRFARDLINIMVEIAVEHFDFQQIADMAGVAQMQPQEQQLFPQALAILQNDKQRKYRVQIETDSTITIDEAEEKQQRTEAVQAVSNMLKGSLELLEAAPEWAPVVLQLFSFGTRSFTKARELEASIEQAIQAVQQKLQQPPPEPPPDPAAQEMQAKMQLEQAKLQLDMQKAQAEAEATRQKMLEEIRFERDKFQAEMQLERERLLGDLSLRREQAEADLVLRAHVAGQKAQQQPITMQGAE